LGAFCGEADFGEAQEDEAEDGRGVFLGLEAAVGAELIGALPEALFKRAVGGVVFRRRNPDHSPPLVRFGRDYRAQRARRNFKLFQTANEVCKPDAAGGKCGDQIV
jgi:hypothetical protein